MDEGFWPSHLPKLNPATLNPNQRAGLRYQAKATEHLQLALAPFSPLIRSEPWIAYRDGHQQRYCAPDMIAFWRNAILVCEMKLNWRRGRADKLTDLYAPLLRGLFPTQVVYPVLVTRNVRGWSGPSYTSIVKLLLDEVRAPFQMLMIQ